MVYKEKILDLFNDNSGDSFEKIALSIYYRQAFQNNTYKRYHELMSIIPDSIRTIRDIPFMPISFFKQNKIKTGNWISDKYFLSSGTSDMNLRSLHLVNDLQWYYDISSLIFKYFYSNDDPTIYGLLPNYIENENSSLINMVRHLSIGNNKEPFYLDDFAKLNYDLERSLTNESSTSVILFGVTFALLDFVQKYQISNDRLKIVFTGGMKRRGQELSYSTVVDKLRMGFPKSSIDAEYGMTELFSQAYAINGSRYRPAPCMQVVSKEINDPLSETKYGKTGQLAIIDLANFDTMSFIMTEDLGRCYSDGSFELLGRVSSSDLRGCSMMYAPID